MRLFTDSFTRLHYNATEREWEAILGRHCKDRIARKCLTYMLNYMVNNERF